MSKFQNSKIYKVVNDVDELIYVGSTAQKYLCQRLRHHRDAAKNERYNMKLHKHMRTLGIDHFKIELIELCPCENSEQLRAREGKYIRNLKPELNKNIAGRNHNDSQKEYYRNNRDSILSYKNEKNECPCGGKYTNSRKARHFRTTIHIKYENEIKQNQSEH